MSDLTLSGQELQDVTGYKRPADQLRELHRQGFWRARRSRVTGEVILERAHYDAVARGMSPPSATGDRPRLRAVR
jgi:hypothetical protein